MIALISLLFFSTCLSLPTYEPPTTQIETTSGPVLCKTVQRGAITECKGIPYAKPPVGDFRFAPPSPPNSWSTPRSALSFGSMCTQWDIYQPGQPIIGSEDCLYLNVWFPSNTLPGDKKEIIVLVHGGGQNLVSAGSDHPLIFYSGPYYNGEYISMHNDVIVVSFNYRLNAFGFLTLNGTLDGGYGTLDQIAVLNWVKDNAEALGGDPEKVGLVGISGGGTAIATLVASPSAEGLFSFAWIGSPLTNHISTKTKMQSLYNQYRSNLNCSGYSTELECLRSVSTESIFETYTRPIAVSIQDGAVRKFPYELATPSPGIGSVLLPYDPAYALANTSINKDVSLVVSTDGVEFAVTYLIGLVHTRALCQFFAEDYVTLTLGLTLDSSVQAQLQNILNLYPDTKEGWVNCMSDVVYTCSANKLAEGAAHGNRKIRRAIYNYTSIPDLVPYATHGDINMAFSGRMDLVPFLFDPIEPKDDAYWISKVIQNYFVTLAGKKHVSGWPQYRLGMKRDIRFNQQTVTRGNSYRTTECAAWNSIH